MTPTPSFPGTMTPKGKGGGRGGGGGGFSDQLEPLLPTTKQDGQATPPVGHGHQAQVHHLPSSSGDGTGAFFRPSRRKKSRTLWLGLSLVLSLLSAGLFLLLTHSRPNSTVHSPPRDQPEQTEEEDSASSNNSPLHARTKMPASPLDEQIIDNNQNQQQQFPRPDPVLVEEALVNGGVGNGITTNGLTDPSQKSTLPLAENPAVFNETGWSSYRPQLYFGLKNRRPDSPLFGMMWYRQKTAKASEKVPLRNWALHEDDVVFMWNQHDGRSFGSQKITDHELGLRTDWFNYGASSWMARIYAHRQVPSPEWSDGEALIVYFALQDKLSSLRVLAPEPGPGGDIHMLEGQSEAVRGNFSLRVRPVSGAGWTLSELQVHGEPFVDMARVGELVKGALQLQPDGNFAFEKRPAEENPNFVALQINIKENSVVELLFQSGDDEAPPTFMDAFRLKEEHFRANFSRAFPIEKNYSAIYHKMGHAALSNLLGGIGVWHGNCWMRSHHFSPPDATKPYGPSSLLSAVPSRTGFPRGFVWDEGFHNMLIHKFDSVLSLQIIGAYLDMMNVDGWIPREIVLGAEAEARIPGNFLVQEDWVANPPMFFYLLHDIIHAHQGEADRLKPELVRLYPRIKKLYFWLRESQNGPKPGSFRWHDRNATTNLELNPGTLSSGFDDYPRASHPTPEEYHLDLRCWMAMASSVLAELARIAEDQQFVPIIEREAKLLSDIDTIDQLHWSEQAQQYSDYGLHSTSVEMVPEKTPQGDTIWVRKVLKAPHYGFVDNVNGYANLFPLLMRLMPANSTRMGPLLSQIADPKQFWTPYGLRSLSPTSPYYNAWNSKGAWPYWRGNIWINMNFFAVAALKHYASLAGPYKELCAQMHEKLRNGLLENVARQYEKTGFLWEHYRDDNGAGEGNHPFTGWTTLILRILSNTY